MLKILIGGTLLAQAETVWNGGSVLGFDHYDVIGNWSNGLPNRGMIARIPTNPAGGVFPVIQRSTNNDNHDEFVDYKLIIEEGATLEVLARLAVEPCDANGNFCGELENAGTLTVMPSGLMTVGNGGSVLNFQTGQISVRQRLSVIGSLINNGYISVRTGNELSNIGTIINFNAIVVDGELKINDGSIDNRAGGRFTLSQGGLANINKGKFLNTGGTFSCKGTLFLNDDGEVENRSAFTVDGTGEVFIFPETAVGDGDKFQNYSEVFNRGTIHIVGGDWINHTGASLVTEQGGAIIMNDAIGSTLVNQEGASIRIDGADFNPGKLFVEAGFLANAGILTNNGLIVNRQLIGNSGTITNNGTLNLSRNTINASAIPLLESSGTVFNAGSIGFADIINLAQINNEGTWRNVGMLTLNPTGADIQFNNEGFFDHESGTVDIS
ncbi:MAG: hypothetical protein AAF597_14695, partial [Bacteroidota bacterium]